MSAKYKSPSFLLPNELNTSTSPSLSEDRASMYSMDFDGSSEYINAGSTPQALVGSNSTYTVSAWVKPDATGNLNIIGAMDSGNRWYFRVLNGYASYAYGAASGGNDYQGTATPVALNTWSHVMFTFDGSTTHKIYVNGVLKITQSNGSAQTITNSQNACIGALNNNGSTQNYFDGQIDEVAIWARALSDGAVADGATATGEVATVYNSGKPGNLIASNLNPVAYYPLGEQAQNTGYLGNEITNGWQFPNGVLQDYVMDFDGTDYIDLNGSQSTMIGENADFTISVWFNTSTNNFQGIFGSFNTQRFYLAINRGTGRFYMALGGGTNESGVMSFSLHTWHNITVVKNGTSIKYYLNGSLGSTVTHNGGNYGTHTQNLFLGAYNQSGNINHFTGKLSNMAIWNTAITDSAEIANIYNNSSPQTTYTVTPQNWWKLNATSVYTPSAPNYTTALNFNSTKADLDYVQFGNTSLSLPASLSIWLKPLGVPPNGYGMPYSDSSGQIYWANGSGGMKYEVTLAGAARVDSTITPTADIGGWQHLVITFTSTATKIYLNGELNNSGSGGTGTNFGQDINIGRWRGAATNILYGFDGSISNFAIFNSELSASRVSTLFNFGTPETNISLSPIHNWKLNNLTTGLNDTGSLASNNGTAGSVNGTGPVQESTSVAVIPSWKIPSALTIATPSYMQALDFNNGTGYTDSIAYGSSFSDVPSASSAHTFSLWFKQDALNSNGERIFATKAGHGAFSIFITNGLLKWTVYDGGSRVVSTNIQAGVWYNIVFGVNGSNEIFLYLNGGSKISAAYSGTITYEGVETGIYLGRGRDATTSRSFNGQLSNFAWFNYVLPETGTESVQSIHNLGTPKDITGWSNNYLWYKLNSLTITDSSGNNRTGVNSNATLVSSDVLATQPVNGVSTTLPSTALQQSDLQFDSPYSNYSLSFDGTGDYIDFGNSLNFVTSNYSLSFWIKTTSTTNLVICEKGVNDEIAIQTMPSGNIRWAGANGFETSGINVSDNNWHQLVFVANGSSSFIYIDGSLNTTGGNKIQASSNTDNFYIGSRAGLYGFNGKLDETSLFNYALSSAQVLEIYNNGRPKDLTTFSGTAPISWWRLGENVYFNDVPAFTVPNSITGAPNGTGSGSITTMISADAPGTYANGIGTNLDIIDRVGDAPLSVANSQSYNMIPSDISPYVPEYVGKQIANNFSMSFDPASNTRFEVNSNSSFAFGTGDFTTSLWAYVTTYSNTPYLLDFRIAQTTGMSIYVNTNGRIEVYINGSTIIGSLGTVLSSGWRNIIVKRDNGTLSTHIDGGSADQSVSNSTDIGSSSNPLVIGARFNSTTQSWPNKIDEVAIFNTALNAGQIYNDIYQPTATGTNQTADLANNPNLPTPVAWYRMGD